MKPKANPQYLSTLKREPVDTGAVVVSATRGEPLNPKANPEYVKALKTGVAIDCKVPYISAARRKK